MGRTHHANGVGRGRPPSAIPKGCRSATRCTTNPCNELGVNRRPSPRPGVVRGLDLLRGEGGRRPAEGLERGLVIDCHPHPGPLPQPDAAGRRSHIVVEGESQPRDQRTPSGRSSTTTFSVLSASRILSATAQFLFFRESARMSRMSCIRPSTRASSAPGPFA